MPASPARSLRQTLRQLSPSSCGTAALTPELDSRAADHGRGTPAEEAEDFSSPGMAQDGGRIRPAVFQRVLDALTPPSSRLAASDPPAHGGEGSVLLPSQSLFQGAGEQACAQAGNCVASADRRAELDSWRDGGGLDEAGAGAGAGGYGSGDAADDGCSDIGGREQPARCRPSAQAGVGYASSIDEFDSDADSLGELGCAGADACLAELVEWMAAQEEQQAAGGGLRHGGLLVEGSFGLSTTDCARCVLELVSRAPAQSGGTLVVVAPARLTFWADACARHAPRLSLLVHHGAGRARSAGMLRGAHVVLTTYSLLAAVEVTVRSEDVLAAHGTEGDGAGAWRRRAGGGGEGAEAGLDRSILHMRSWARVVFDEADRHLARPTTKRSQAAASLLAPRRWGLAGAAAGTRREVRSAVSRSIGL